MPRIIVGKWGKNLAIRFPGEIVKATGLCDGDRVEIEAHDGNIVIRRPIAQFTAGRRPALVVSPSKARLTPRNRVSGET